MTRHFQQRLIEHWLVDLSLRTLLSAATEVAFTLSDKISINVLWVWVSHFIRRFCATSSRQLRCFRQQRISCCWKHRPVMIGRVSFLLARCICGGKFESSLTQRKKSISNSAIFRLQKQKYSFSMFNIFFYSKVKLKFCQSVWNLLKNWLYYRLDYLIFKLRFMKNPLISFKTKKLRFYEYELFIVCNCTKQIFIGWFFGWKFFWIMVSLFEVCDFKFSRLKIVDTSSFKFYVLFAKVL